MEELIAKMQALVEDETCTDDIAELYLQLAESKLLARLYPFTEYDENGDEISHEVPEKYLMTEVELAVRLFERRGGEGETSHSENGVSRQYGSTDDWDILQRVTPRAKVG